MSKKTILIVAYAFPPYNSIGARRWAKFAKYLTRQGHKVHVIHAANPYDKEAVWTNDVADSKIQKYVLPNKWPSFSFNPSKSLLSKVSNKLFIKLISIFGKGFPYDESRFWKKVLQKKIIEVCTQNPVDILIATGPPYRVPCYSAIVKDKFPAVKFYVDIRDQWLVGKLYDANVSEKMLQEEKSNQQKLFGEVDRVLVTDESNKTQLMLDFPDMEKKIKVIPHSFDLDEFDFGDIQQRSDDLVKFIYGGNMPMIDKEESIIPFLDGVAQLKKENVDLYNKTEFHFYGKPAWLVQEVNDRGLGNFYFNDFVTPKEFNSIAVTFDYLMIFLPNYSSNYLITKNIDYLPLKRKIIVCAKEGKATQFVVENQVGSHLDPLGNIRLQLEKNILGAQSQENEAPFNKLIENYNIDEVTKKILE